jgi:nicotinamidase-related amidase
MKSALIVIDVQQSFRHRPYWSDVGAAAFVERLQSLIDLCDARAVPVLQVFHVEEGGIENPFSRASGHVTAFPELKINPAAVFTKSVHSAMFAATADGQSVDYWLRRHSVGHLIVSGIRTEQCCETTTRHASDIGYDVTYAVDATLTFPMTSASGRTFSVEEITERTALVLDDRFAKVRRAAAIAL